MYEELKAKYIMGYVNIATLKKWVVIELKKPGKGITPEQFKEITGEDYDG